MASLGKPTGIMRIIEITHSAAFAEMIDSKSMLHLAWRRKWGKILYFQPFILKCMSFVYLLGISNTLSSRQYAV